MKALHTHTLIAHLHHPSDTERRFMAIAAELAVALLAALLLGLALQYLPGGNGSAGMSITPTVAAIFTA